MNVAFTKFVRDGSGSTCSSMSVEGFGVVYVEVVELYCSTMDRRNKKMTIMSNTSNDPKLTKYIDFY